MPQLFKNLLNNPKQDKMQKWRNIFFVCVTFSLKIGKATVVVVVRNCALSLIAFLFF